MNKLEQSARQAIDILESGYIIAPSVRECALEAAKSLREVLEQPEPVQQPLSEDQIATLHREAYTTGKAFTTIEVYRYFARAIEAAHGITGETK